LFPEVGVGDCSFDRVKGTGALNTFADYVTDLDADFARLINSRHGCWRERRRIKAVQ